MRRGGADMFRITALCIVAWSTGIGIARAENPATAEDVARAEAYASEGFDAYTRGDYSAAVTLYRKALNAAASADILYNLARIYDVKLKDRASAIEYYKRYARDTGADPERLRAANERLAQLRELDKVAREPVESTPATRGEHRAQARAATTATAAATSSGGFTATQVVGLVTAALGVVGIGLGVGFGLAAKSDADDAHAACDGNACRTQQGVDAAHAASRAAAVSTGAFIAGGALAITGSSLLLWGGRSERSRESTSATVSPYLAPAAAGMAVTGRW